MEELDLVEAFLEMIDIGVDESTADEILAALAELIEEKRKHFKEFIFLLSEIGKYCESPHTREYAVNALSEALVHSIKLAEKPEEPEISEIYGETTEA